MASVETRHQEDGPRRGAKTNKRTKKRPRHFDTAQETQERYDKLLYTAQRDLHKQSKVVKTFLCQKIIRKLKQAKNDKEEQVLASFKALSIDVMVQEGLRRLGLLHLDPKLRQDEEKDQEESTDETQSKAKAPNEQAPPTPQEKALLDKAFAHKKMQTCLEEWNDKITEYRRWLLRLSSQNDPDFLSESNRIVGKSKKKKKQNKHQQDMMMQDPASNSTFVSLGGDDNDDQVDYSAYGPGASMYQDDIPAKKNRKGQRARRAKAMALEAKKQGKEYKSLNWRKPKKQEEQQGEEDHSLHHTKEVKGKRQETAEAAMAHPSWAAKKAQASNIVAFQGTKITFD